MTLADIALGSNLGPGPELFERAIELLGRQPGTRVVGRSEWIRTEPLGPAQPLFHNGVVRIETTLSPEALLSLLQKIERRLGRVHNGRRWGPRVLDLDLVRFDDRTILRPRLRVPYGLDRPFVRVPLAQLDTARIR